MLLDQSDISCGSVKMIAHQKEKNYLLFFDPHCITSFCLVKEGILRYLSWQASGISEKELIDATKRAVYHSVACLILEFGRKDLFPEMLGFNSPAVTTPIDTNWKL